MSAKVERLASAIKKLNPQAQDFFKLVVSDPDNAIKTYEIVASPDGRQAGIKCLDCNMTSWNYNDVREKYCGNCHEFHDIKAKKKMYPHLFREEKTNNDS